MKKVAENIALLAGLSIGCALGLVAGTHKLDLVDETERVIRSIIGNATAIFAVALTVFLIARFVRRKTGDENAGLLSGSIAALAASGLKFIGIH
jgi:hypothetical protein